MEASLKLGNGDWGVKNDSLLAYDDVGGKFRPLPFDFTRASSATVVNKQGLIETVQSGIPRIDFNDDVNGALKLEPQSTNLLTQSEDFSNSYWTKSGASVVSGFTSPSGEANAFKLVEDTSTVGHSVFRNSSTVTLSSHSFSCFVKTNGRNVKLDFFGGTNNAIFDLTNGTVISANGTGLTAKIELFSGNWYRCSVTQVQTSTTIYPNILTVDNFNNSTYQGDGTSGVYIYGAQLEQKSYATSYIPTSGASATRNQELCNDATPVINSEEGTLYAEISALADEATTKSISINSGSSTNVVRISFFSNVILARIVSPSGTTSNLTYTVPSINDFYKVAFKYNATLNNHALYVNGALRFTSTQVIDLGSSLTTLSFADGNAAGNFYGNTKDLKYYPKALADVQLQDLTTL